MIGPLRVVRVGPRMQQGRCLRRQEAVGVEEILLQPEPDEAPLQIPGAIAGDAMPQDEVLGPRRRPDRVGLDEAHLRHRPPQQRRRKKRSGERMGTEALDGRHGGWGILSMPSA